MNKSFDFKKILPHIIAIAVFLIVAVIFCKPALESGVILKQGDVSGWHGMSHQSFEYKEQHGHIPLWVTSMFSGMPGFQVAMEGAWSPLGVINEVFQLWLPQPMNFFFLACICFYFLCLCLRIKPYAAIIGALGFAYCSFSPIIITAGHNTQMLALAYAPAVLGGAILIFDKKYISGFTLTALFTALHISQGHQQITYYVFIVMVAMTIAYAIRLIRGGELPHLLKSVGLMALAGIIGVLVNALVLFTLYDFAKESKRGGQLVMDESVKTSDLKDGKTSGLSRDYAFQWSYGKAETFSLMFPGVKAYGMHYAVRNDESYMFPEIKENSNVIKHLTEKLNVPESGLEQIRGYMSQKLYWGEQPFTNGPVYLGAIICFLFLFGMFYLDNKHKWWILTVCIIGILMSWGSNLPGFNNFLFDHLPFYNKFRVPTMTLVIPQLLFPVIAALTLNKLFQNQDPKGWKKFRLGLMATGLVFVIALLYYASSDFSLENKQRTSQFNAILASNDPAMESKMATLNNTVIPLKDNQLYEEMVMNFKGSPDAQKNSREIVAAIRKDRADIFLSDIFRSFIFVLIAAAFIALYLKKKMNATVMIAGVTLAAAIDLLGFGMKYLNEKSFDSKDAYESTEFPLSNADIEIQKDMDPNFRVFNMAGGDPFQESKTSYYHKSIGGYHAAKLGIYDDLATYQMSGNPNVSVLNMLNTKYVIQRQGDNLVAARNPEALGNAWFVKGIKFVNGPVEEMKALNRFNPRDTAIVDNKFKSLVTNIVATDSNASIRMTAFDNDAITYQSTSSAPHLAIFSEIYYKDWNAYIDGKKTDILKANYVLRGLVVPAGAHKIEFKFEPKIFYTGRSISAVSSWLVFILLIAFIVYTVKKKRIE